MRSTHHLHHQQNQKHETSTSPRSTTPTPAISPVVQPLVSSSPISVIVPTRNFTTIIQHTSDSVDGGNKVNENFVQSKDLLSRMVITRTSVISPNPEHVLAAKFADKSNCKIIQQSTLSKQSSPFDFNDPTRVSAFSRPQSMNLNLAIA